MADIAVMKHKRKRNFKGPSLANRVSKLEKSAKEVEYKLGDLTTLAAVTSTATFTLLNGIGTGDFINQREGRVVHLKSIQLAYVWSQHASATQTSLRVIIVQDRQPNELIFPILDYLVTANVTSFRQLDNRSRFITHYNAVHTMSDTGEKNGYASMYKRFNIKTQYDNTGALVVDITTNALYMIMISSEPTNAPSILQNTRLRYTDE